jgi:acylphosphatase
MNAYRFIIVGKVQGVAYEKSIQQVASLGQLKGFVKKLKDGSVEVVVDLDECQLDEFTSVLKKGSSMSEVEDITYEILEEDDLLYDGFEIRY